MRLLEVNYGSNFTPPNDWEDDEIPPYVILSHTWDTKGEDGEVTFKDLLEGKGKQKGGYRKLQFCADQSRRDGQRYFWVDTCCIDKSNNVELNTAITSMFHWYQRAVKCYVYLSDVSATPADSALSPNAPWLSTFRKSRWFTRGWTLQELLAPAKVEFYDKTGVKLGDRSSLERHICDITGIPAKALRGHLLSSFSIEERFSWQKTRQSRKPEDRAYSLSGICEVSMIPIYGEGEDRAMARLRREIYEVSKGPKWQDFTLTFSDTEVIGVESFVAREKELEKIHFDLSSDGSRRTVTLHGMGGIGKTQLAVAYARRHKDSYSAILWLNAQDETSVKQSFVRIAKRIVRQHPSARSLCSVDLDRDLERVVEAVNAWLSETGNTRWLAIYDNYDNPKIRNNNDRAAVDIHRYLPDAFQGSIIITTRSPQVRIGQCIPVGKLTDMRDCVELLSSVSRRDLSIDDPSVSALARKLDGLPLALATAGAYLDQVTVSVKEYLELYDSSWLQLHQSDCGLNEYQDRTLLSTWHISLNQIRRQNELSAKLLCLWCYFSNQDLWFELLRAGPSEDLPWIQKLTSNLHVFTEAMRLLCNYGLVNGDKLHEENFESGGYSIHTCVHSWTVYVLNERWDSTLAHFAINAVGRHVPSKNAARPWITQRRLLQHAERCLQHMNGQFAVAGGMDSSLNAIACLFSEQSKLPEAEQMYKQALDGRKKALGAEHTSTLEIVHNLGLLYADQGKLAEAEQMCKQALQGFNNALGAEHSSTLDAVNNLGSLYADQGKLEEAEQMYKKALQGKERALGIDHMSTLETVNNLGLLYAKRGKLVEAEQMYKQALQGKETVCGAEHTSTLVTVNNLGLLYANQGRLAEAEQMYKQALQGFKKALGQEHTLALQTINNIGFLYSKQGNLAEAEQMYKQALQGFKKALGQEHTSTLQTVNNIGLLYSEQGMLAEAEQMYKQVLQGFKKAVGAEHMSTLGIVNNLGNLYTNQGKPAEAEHMYKQALQGHKKTLGAQHISTLGILNNLGVLYAKQGRLEEAEQIYIEALQGYKRTLGTEHTSTLETLNNLGLLYVIQGKLAEAEQMYKQALQGFKKALGQEHKSSLQTINNIGLLYSKQGKPAEAEQMYKQALQGYKKTLGVEHISTLGTLNNLGVLYSKQGRLEEAEQMYQQALQGYKKICMLNTAKSAQAEQMLD